MKHLNTRWAYWSFCLLLAAGLVFNAGKRVMSTAQAATSTLPKPYTVKVRQLAVDGNGVRRDPEGTLTVAVRSDGSRAIVNTKHYPAGDEVSRVVQYASGGRVEVGDLWDIKTSWKSRAKPAPSRWHRNPDQDCLRALSGESFTSMPESLLGRVEIAGHRAAMIKRGNSTEWFALDAGCAIIKSRVDFGNSVSEQELISLVPGEPDPTLFYVPASFREVPPSEYLKTMVDRLKLDCPGRCVERAAEQDKRYREHNSQ